MNKEIIMDTFVSLTQQQKDLIMTMYNECPSEYDFENGDDYCDVCEERCLVCWFKILEDTCKDRTTISKYTDLIKNLDEVIEKEYLMNLSSLNRSKDGILQAFEDSKEDGFEDTYFSTRIEFQKQTKEVKHEAIAGGCVRMIVFKKWVQEVLGVEDVTVDIIKIDNYVTMVRAIVHHGLEKESLDEK